ncbi:copper-binding protein [Caballeronia telluris]|nr:copper-binding protein [Caballeronia telluris]
MALADTAIAQNAASGAGDDTRGAATVAEAQAHVVGIDPATNSVALQGPQGRIVEVAVNPEVGDVKKLQIGDTVNIQYRNALLVRATKVKSTGIRERVDTEATIPASGGVAATARSVQILATIQKIDAQKRLITLRGPSRTEVFQVAPDVSLDGLKTGDTVRAEFVSATAIQVLRGGAAVK